MDQCLRLTSTTPTSTRGWDKFRRDFNIPRSLVRPGRCTTRDTLEVDGSRPDAQNHQQTTFPLQAEGDTDFFRRQAPQEGLDSSRLGKNVHASRLELWKNTTV